MLLLLLVAACDVADAATAGSACALALQHCCLLPACLKLGADRLDPGACADHAKLLLQGVDLGGEGGDLPGQGCNGCCLAGIRGGAVVVLQLYDELQWLLAAWG